ncbi:MAG: TonB-dependent receptor [Alphaproteobacteria bacterium]|nr:TonB-dependent receptor [Alphaproteobacteria bacterium]
MSVRLKLPALAGAAALGLTMGLARADTGVETVTVTAEKTAESILDVGINVTAISSEELRLARVVTLSDVATQVPNFDVKTNIPGAQQIVTVRGVGLDDFSSTNNSSVGVYVDDVFLASFAEMDFGMYDLDRVEVLKGPQGTLYGRNSTAGAINIISARPSLDGVFGRLSLGYGNYDTFQADGFVNVPLSGDFALRLSAQTLQQGIGYWYSPYLGSRLGAQHIFRERAQALWTPAAGLNVLLKFDAEQNDSQISSGKFFGDNSTTSAPCPDFRNPGHCTNLFGFTDTDPNVFHVSTEHAAPYHVNSENLTLHVDDDLGWATLTSVTGAISFRREFYIDADASPAAMAEFDQNDHVAQFSEELRLAGTSGPLEWLAGAYYSWDQVHSFTPGTLRDLLGADVFIHSDQRTQSAALFGQAKYKLTDTLTLVAGLRGTYETRAYKGGSTYYLTGTTTPYPCAPPFFVCPTFEDDTIRNASASWHVGLNYNPDRSTLVYLSAAESTKSGGFFNGITFQSQALAPYKPEHLTDIEAGVKSNLFDSLLIDGSVFYYDYGDYQSQTFTSVGAVSLIKLSNIPHAHIYGLDLGATWLPFDGFSLRAGLGLMHSRLGRFTTVKGSSVVTVPGGNRMPDAPGASFNATARYERPLSDALSGALQFGAIYESSRFFEALNTPYLSGPESWVFNGRVSLLTRDTDWELAFWIQNMFNEQHTIQATDDGQPIGAGYRMFNPPRTFGLALTHKFE